MRNKVFGPVVSVLYFKDEKEAIRLAYGSDYASAGGAFSRDFGKVSRMARAILAGRFWINTDGVMNHTIPFGGSGNRGCDREEGIEVFQGFNKNKAIFADLSDAPIADTFVMR